MKGIIYYTDNRIDRSPIINIVRKFIQESGLPIVSCSLRPIDFGDNIVLKGRVRSYPTMVEQILMALEKSTAKDVFFCEHDVLYHKSHFELTPERDDVYYYNANVWRWIFLKDFVNTQEYMSSLSGLFCNRELAVRHYKYRLQLTKEWGLDINRAREPRWAHQFGYEPGTKKISHGGITDEDHIQVRSALPNVDIRHPKNFSSFEVVRKNGAPPPGYKEGRMADVEGWDLKGLFGL